MMILVTGGAGSGKSAFAEKLIVDSGITPRSYIACMKVKDAEDELRVSRHRKLRNGKGFTSYEFPTDIGSADIPPNGAILIEDIGNLAANECFSTEMGFDGAVERMLSDITKLSARSALTVAVTCEIGADGIEYDEFTLRFIETIARTNALLAEKADTVYEVAAGLPIILKGA